jgi:hypothetical protein
MQKRAGLRRRRVDGQGQRIRSGPPWDPVEACVVRALDESGGFSLTCPICRRGELLEQVARANPRWERERVERFVDGLLRGAWSRSA